MKNRNQRIVTSIISIVYAVTLIAYISYLGIQYSQGPKKSEATFKSLTTNISNILNEYDLTSEKFSKAVTDDSELDFFDNLSNLAGFQLTIQDNLIYSYPDNLSKTQSTKSSLVRAHSTSLTATDGTPVTLTAAIYLLMPGTIISGGKVAFMVILVATLLAAIFLIYAYISSKSSQDDSNNSETEDYTDNRNSFEKDINNTETGSAYDSIFSASARTSPVQQTFTSGLSSRATAEEGDSDSLVAAYKDDRPTAEELFNNNDIEDITSAFFEESDSKKSDDKFDQFTIDDKPVEFVDETPNVQAKTTSDEENIKSLFSNNSFSENKKYGEEDKLNDQMKLFDNSEASEVEDMHGVDTKASSSPKGLFSQDTNVGYEPYLLPRLNNELVRSASQEQDLSLMLIKIPGLAQGSLEKEKICTLVIDTVKFQDLIFEFGNDGFSAIFQNTTVDEALSIADELHEGIEQILISEGKRCPVSIGISSKSFRLISGERLANEAAQALEHALKDSKKPIVAFKVNTNLYKNYLSKE